MTIIYRAISIVCAALLIGVSAQAQTSDIFEILETGDTDSFVAVINDGADINALNDDGAPLIAQAILSEKYDLATILISRGADLSAAYENYIGANALMLAVAQNNIDIATALIDAGINIDQIDAMGDPAINWAAYYGYQDFVKLLLSNGARTDLSGHGTAREISMRRGFQELVLMLSRHEKIDVPDPDTAMLVDAVEAGDQNAVEEILSMGISPNSQDFTGRPILELAARTNADITKLLLDAGAIPDRANEIGFTALMEAARDGKIGAAKELIAAGANSNHRSKDNGLSLSVIHMAALSGDPEMVALIAGEGANLDAQGRDGGTALSWSLGNESMDVSVRLLELGADPYVKGKYGDVASYILSSDSAKLAPLKELIKARAAN